MELVPCGRGIWCTAGNHYAGFWDAHSGGLATNGSGMARGCLRQTLQSTLVVGSSASGSRGALTLFVSLCVSRGLCIIHFLYDSCSIHDMLCCIHLHRVCVCAHVHKYMHVSGSKSIKAWVCCTTTHSARRVQER